MDGIFLGFTRFFNKVAVLPFDDSMINNGWWFILSSGPAEFLFQTGPSAFLLVNQ